MNNLIIFPFAFLQNTNSCASLKKKDNIKEIYYKNIIVSTISAKLNNKDCDVALVTNTAIDRNVLDILHKYGIKHFNFEFDSFKFESNFAYCLAFYKLCAIKHSLELNYDNILCLDLDTYTKNDFSYLWNNIKNHTIFYNRYGSTLSAFGSLKALPYLQRMYNDAIERVGGEFIAGSKNSLQNFIDNCEKIYKIMIDENIKVNCGDEYISSLAAALDSNSLYNGERYIYRLETGYFRDIPVNNQIGTIPILHLPAEKKYGIKKICNYILNNGKLPNIKYVIKNCHIKNATLKSHIKKILFKLHIIN